MIWRLVTDLREDNLLIELLIIFDNIRDKWTVLNEIIALM